MSSPAPASVVTGDNRFRKSLKGAAWALLSVLIFSGWFVATRFSVTHELRFWDVIVLRFGGGTLLLMPLLISRRQHLMRHGREGLLYAFLWGAPFVLLLTLGLKLTSVAEASIVTPTLMPLFAGLIGWLALRERLSTAKRLGYLGIAAGLAIVLLGTPMANVQSATVGLLPLAIAALMWAGYSVLFRRSRLTPLESTALICFWSAVFFLPPYLLFGLSRLEHAPWGEIAFHVVYQGLLMSVVAMVSYNRAVNALGPQAAAAIIAFVPVLSALLAAVFLNEMPSTSGVAAILLVAAGVVVTAWPSPPPPSGPRD